MTDQSPKVDTSAHQQEYQLKQNDALDIALLANVVGKELTQVDKFTVSGLQKATRISQDKIFNNQPTTETPPQIQNKPQGIPPELQQVSNPKPPPIDQPKVITTSTPVVDDRMVSYLKSIDDRLKKMENLYSTLIKTITENTDQVQLTLTKNDKN